MCETEEEPEWAEEEDYPGQKAYQQHILEVQRLADKLETEWGQATVEEIHETMQEGRLVSKAALAQDDEEGAEETQIDA